MKAKDLAALLLQTPNAEVVVAGDEDADRYYVSGVVVHRHYDAAEVEITVDTPA